MAANNYRNQGASLGAAEAANTLFCEGYRVASIDLRGTFTATVTFEASWNGGTTWTAIKGWAATSPDPVAAGATATTATAAGVYAFLLNGAHQIRARVSAYTSGTIASTISIN